MRRVLLVLASFAVPGTSGGDDGALDAGRHDAQGGRAAAAATGGPTLGPLVDPDAPVPMEIRTAEKPGAGASAAAGCALPREGSSRLTSPQCMGCHGGATHATVSHQVEVPYQAAIGRGRVRPQEEAVRRGAFLPEGKVRCTSCHDGRSRVRYRLAIPAAELRPMVKPDSASTFEPAPSKAPLAAAEGVEVAVRPLCLECHPME